MSLGKKARRKARQMEKRRHSRNARRRVEYKKKNEQERGISGVTVSRSFSVAETRTPLERAYDESGQVSSRETERRDYYTKNKIMERESLERRAKQVILEKVDKKNLGTVMQWRLDVESPAKCANYVYTVKDYFGVTQFIVTIPSSKMPSKVFYEGNCDDEEKFRRMYHEAFNKARGYAAKLEKELVDNIGDKGKQLDSQNN